MSRAEKIEAAHVHLREAWERPARVSQDPGTRAVAERAAEWAVRNMLDALALPADPPSGPSEREREIRASLAIGDRRDRLARELLEMLDAERARPRPAAVEPAPVPVGGDSLRGAYVEGWREALFRHKPEDFNRASQVVEASAAWHEKWGQHFPLVADAGQDAERATAERDTELAKLLAERNRADAAEAKLAETERERDECKERLARRVDMHDADGKALMRTAADLAVERGRLAALVSVARTVVGEQDEFNAGRCEKPKRGPENEYRYPCGKCDTCLLGVALSDLDPVRLAHDERVRAEGQLEGLKAGVHHAQADAEEAIATARAEGHAAGVAEETERAATLVEMECRGTYERAELLAARIRASAAKEE